MSAAEQLTFTRFQKLEDTVAVTETMTWPALVAVLSKCAPFKGDKQHPGWSPAEFEPAARALVNVKSVTMLALDYDNKVKGKPVPNPFTVEQATEAFAGYKGLIYTTRNHTQEWPRFRVVLPLTRPVTKEEYETLWQAADARWPGGDQQPKDPSRFWYMPGVIDQPGAEFVPVELHGELLDPDLLLSEQPAPSAPEPVQVRTPEPNDNLMDRARAYIATMPPAISGSGGHGATFAVARKVVKDFGIDEQRAFILLCEYNLRCKPPWTDKELRHKIRQAVTRGKVINPVQDRPPQLPKPWKQSDAMAGLAPSVPNPDGSHDAQVVPDDAWRKMLVHNQGGQVTKDVHNVVLILKNASGFHGALSYNKMAHSIVWTREPAYDVGIDPPRAGEELADHQAPYVQGVLRFYFNLSISKDMVWEAMTAAGHDNAVHPVQNYLDGLTWDGVPRLNTWLHTYMGCDATEYTSNVGKWWLISAVARGYRPGCQVDYVLVLEGKQGKGKSQAIKALGDPWVLDQLPNIRDAKAAAEVIGDRWIVEIPELDALKGAGMSRIKSFVTQQFDKYRPAYARATVNRPRPCVFVATTNEHSYLDDPTGARRFWPVRVVGTIQRKQLEQDRDQLWAEAKFEFENGTKWYPEKDEHQEQLEEQQEQRREQHQWEDVIAQHIAKIGEENVITTNDILGVCLNKPPSDWTQTDREGVQDCLTALGYEKYRPWAKDETTGKRLLNDEGKEYRLPARWKKIDT